MHRRPLRVYFRSQIIIWIFAAALLLSAGCGFQWPPPEIPQSLKDQVFHLGPPIALLSFEPGRSSGKIIGELHGWPIPHLEGSEQIPPRSFTYVCQFTVTAKSDADGLPSGAAGATKVYFHEDMPPLNFTDPRAYATGQEVALDTASLSFAFTDNHRVIGVRMISQQKSARPFVYAGNTIEPPKDRDSADKLQGEYSADLGGYILRSLNE